MLSVAAAAQMDGDAFAFVEDLDAAGGQARLDLRAGEAVGDRVIVGVDIDVIVDADPSHAPLAVFVGLVRKRLERRPIDLLEQLAAGDAEPRRLCLSLSWAMSSPIAASTSARLVKIRRLSRPSSHRSTISTACSTFALSRGFLGLAGRFAVP